MAWDLFPGQAPASLDVEQATPSPSPSPQAPEHRRLTDAEVGRLHQAARDRNQLRWWCSQVHPLSGELVRVVLKRSAFPATVKAIFVQAGVIPRGSRP